MLTQLQHLLYRALVFRQGMRTNLLTSVRMQLEAGIPIIDTFQLMQAATKDHSLRRLADISLSSAVIGQPFASNYAAEGFFNDREARLLIAGEEQGALPEMIQLITKTAEPEQSFFAVVIQPNAQWLLGLLAMLALTIYGVTYEDLMTFGEAPPADFFLLGHWLQEQLLGMTIALALLMAIYIRLRTVLGGTWRSRLRAIGLFAAFDYGVIAQLCELMAALFKKGVAQSTVVTIAISVVSSGRRPGYFETALRRVLDEMHRGPTLLPALGRHLLDPEATAQLSLQAPRQTVAELERAFGNYALVAREKTKQFLSALGVVTALVAALGTFFLLVPMIEVVMGAGIAIDY